MSVVEPSERKRPTRHDVIDHVQSLGREVVAVLPFHYPRALLRAHRLHPIELWGPPHVPRHEGSRHFQAYTCDIVVKATSFLVRGGLDRTKGILVPHTCDALQGMGSVLRDFLDPKQRVMTLYLPRGRRPSDRTYLRQELERLAEVLVEVGGHRPTEADWHEAFAAEEAADEALADLYRRRAQIAVSDRTFYETVRAREYLTAEQFCELAATLPEGDPNRRGVGLMMSGIVAEPFELLDQIQEMGAFIAGDDLACGFRRVYPPASDTDPFDRIASRLLQCPPDSTCGSLIAVRVDTLETRMRALGARGLLVYDPKFCEPELFDVPLLKKHLSERGFPVLHVEFEMGEQLPHQTLSRIEAFVETLA